MFQSVRTFSRQQRALRRTFTYVDRSLFGRVAFHVILLGQDRLAVLNTRQELEFDGTERFHLYPFRRHLVNNRYHYYLIRTGQRYKSGHESVLVIDPIDLNPDVKKKT